MAKAADCRILQFRQIHDPRGTLTPIESAGEVPFEIRRIYYLYDIAPGASRAGHGHKALQQVLIAISGTFDVHVDDGRERRVITLSHPYEGLYIPSMIWREIDNFTPRAVCLALASLPYDEADYFRKYEDFIQSAREQP